MRIAFLLSTLGGSPLQSSLERGMAQLGNQVSDYHPGRQYDLILVFNQTAHNPNYEYPPFPKGNTPIAFIDSAEYGYFKRLPGVIHKYANAFSQGSLEHDTKNLGQQLRLLTFLKGKSFPYFLREYSKYVSFPLEYHPIDYPLYHHSVCGRAPNRDEYLKRSLELFCRWGASHPWRMAITQALRDCHTRCEIDVLQDGVVNRMPQKQFFERTFAAKCSVSFDGYGSGSFRVTEVLSRCLLLQGPMSIIQREPLLDGVHCLNYNVESDGENFISTDVCVKLKAALAYPEHAYKLHEAGYYHCMQHYTERATAKYVMDTIEKHNWSKPTELSIKPPPASPCSSDGPVTPTQQEEKHR